MPNVKPVIRIRRAKLADSAVIRALEKKVWKEDVTSRFDMPTFITRGWTFVATDHGKIVGALIALATRDGNVCVADWLLLPAYQHRGIGSALYRALFRATPGRAIDAYVEKSYTSSLAGHRALGFRAVKMVRDAYGVECRTFAKGPHVLFRRKSTKRGARKTR